MEITDYFGNPIEIDDEVVLLKNAPNISFGYHTRRIVTKIDLNKGKQCLYVVKKGAELGAFTFPSYCINLKYVSLPIPLGS